ncbi:NADH:flavin oxidoreductase/NADH oxidase [Nadsonia fulvescens var. elongata DSM 6958]|uniref:NADH:flavin oxidoreductase/NADH oxidase n=1 Tax=Nadsonia fulvescens var. elongata DSM 6958 TaxID=857566 RepID=A0A1E3PIH8_9ASCO|nr:NADH:flavin oxidoreductase/NADH oxidase [Nadsonia fulvescens var. elongata DSM 6958]
MTKESAPTATLFTPIKVGSNQLQHRVFLPPLTRRKASDDHVPTDIMLEYYNQRSSRPGTLLITEGTFPSRELGGYSNVPGLWNQDQINGWKKITDKVHANQSVIYAQIWALGRVASPEYMKAHDLPVIGPSPLSFPEENGHIPHELTIEEIETIKQAYVQAALNALEAGFDGIEVHSANGYLLNQFVSSHSNVRTDKYGGSIENRARLVLEVVAAILEAYKEKTGSYEVAASKIGIRFSPWGSFQGMEGATIPNELATYVYLASELERRAQEGKRLAYIHVVEARGNEALLNPYYPKAASNEWLYLSWQGMVLRAGSYNAELAHEHIKEHSNTLVGFGRYFISNPDIVNRLEQGIELNEYDRSTFYTPGTKGYIDYPFAS